MKKKNKKYIWIGLVVIIGIIILIFTGINFLSVTPGCPDSPCNPVYYSFKNTCYMTCGLNTGTVTYNTCDTKNLYQLFQQYMGGLKIYKDSSCTISLENYVCTPNWKCDGFTPPSKSKNGIQTRKCRDLNNCGTNENKPITSRNCKPKCIPNWKTGKWGECINGEQTRSVIDTNNCKTDKERPPEYRTCDNTLIKKQPIGLIQKFKQWFAGLNNNGLISYLRGKQRPLVSGLEIAMEGSDNYTYVCSIGKIVEKDGVKYILTASHCVDDSLNINLFQGYLLNGLPDYVGYSTKIDKATDTALLKLSYDTEGIEKDANGNKIKGFGKVKKGDLVYKIGRTTGLTWGYVTDSSSYTKDNNGNKIKEFEIQSIKSTDFCNSGDSGSAIILYPSFEIVGILSSRDASGNCYSKQPQEIQRAMGI